MRRRIAILLSLLLVLNSIPVNIVYAASNIKFKELSNEMVINGETVQLKEDSNTEETDKVTLEWSIGDAGKYQLTYYTDTNTVSGYSGTSKINVVFDVLTDKVVYNVEATTTDPAIIPTVTGGEGTKTISVTSSGTDHYIKTNIGNLQILVNVDMDKKKIQFGTNGISKGNFTEFELDYEGNKKYIGVLRGLNNVSISPTHFTKDTTDLKTGSLTELTVTGDGSSDIPGDKPGIKVQFDLPNIIKGDEFQPIEDERIKASIALAPRLQAKDTVSGSDAAKLEFKLGADGKPVVDFLGSKIAEENAAHSKKVSIEKIGNKRVATVYLSASDEFDNTTVKEQVIKWSTLKESMFVGGNITFIGLYDQPGKEFSNYTQGKTLVLNTGVTYLKYVPQKAEEGKVILEITPYKYKDQTLYYWIYESDTGAIDTSKPFIRFPYKYEGKNGETFPITVPSDGECRFWIRVSFSDGADVEYFDAQKIIYDTTGIVGAPSSSQIVNVNDIYVVPKEGNEKEIDASGFNIQWNVPKSSELEETLKNGDLYYEISISDERNSNEADRDIIAIIRHSNGTPNPQIYAGNINSKDDPKYEEGRNSGLITLNGVMLKEILRNPQVLKYSGTGSYLNRNDYPSESEFVLTDVDDYKIPKTYYLRVRTILDSATGKIKTNLYDSEPYAISLDKVTELVPIPSGLAYKQTPGSLVDGTLSFNNVDLENYNYYEIIPRKQKITTQSGLSASTLPRTYEVYLYQDSYIQKESGTSNDKTVHNNGITDEWLAKNEMDSDKIYEYPTILTDSDNELQAGEALLAQLRQGKIIKIKYCTNDIKDVININLKNLDSNQSYNIRVRTTLKVEKADGSVLSPDPVSKLSNVVGFTTGTGVKPPTDGERGLPTPKDYTAIALDNMNSQLKWMDPELADTTSLTYEIVRVTDKVIDPELVKDGKKKDLTQFISSINRKDSITFKADSTNKALDTDNIVRYIFKDNTLEPNKIYYYYIRTVKGNQYSEWIYQSVTTKNIEKPEDLKGISSTTNSIDISFLAKAPLNTVPSKYDFEILIQADNNGEWVPVSGSDKVKVSETNQGVKEGYTEFRYTIKGLKSNTRYNIKVCMIDKTSGSELKSLYTDVIYMRTAFSQEEEDQKEKYEEYLDKFDKEVEKLKTRSYWTVEVGEVYKYRADYVNSEIASQKEYLLVNEKDSSNLHYYLPASTLETCNDNQVILQLQLGDYTATIRPNTLTTDNETIRDALDNINTKRIKDYYIGLHFKKTSYNDKINNEEPYSPKLTIDMEIIEIKQEDIIVEADIIEALTDIVDRERKDFIKVLEKRVGKSHISNEELDELIESAMDNIETTHAKKVDKILDKTIKEKNLVNKIEKSILISAKNNEDCLVGGYYWASGWQSVQVYSNGTTAFIEAAVLGTYIFTGQQSLIETVPSLAPYQNFINQYGLTEFFTLDSYMIKTPVTKQQIAGATARVMGAAQGTDYVTFLEQKGIKGINKLSLQKTARQDETIYIIMQAYEIMKNRKVKSIKIDNYQCVTNIGAFQPYYQDYVYAAVQLRIVDNPDSKVYPSKQVTVEEFIKELCIMTQR